MTVRPVLCAILLFSFIFAIPCATAQTAGPAGTYVFVSDSDGGTADDGTVVTLTFAPGGSLAFTAVGPGQSMKDSGTYNVTGANITLSLPGLGKSASNKPYALTANSLTLPFKLFSNGNGTSKWVGRAQGGGEKKDDKKKEGEKTGDESGEGDKKKDGKKTGDDKSRDKNGDNGKNGGGKKNGKDGDGGNSDGNDDEGEGEDDDGDGTPDNPDGRRRRDRNPDGDKPAANPALAPYVGDYVGMGWGYETRFKQTRREFVSQMAGGRTVPGQTGEETIMSLMVKHSTEFAITVDAAGNVTGHGVVTYDLFPNLCGVATLTKQVNEAVNLMDKIAFIFQLSSEVTKSVNQNFRREWHDKERELLMRLETWKNTQKNMRDPIQAMRTLQQGGEKGAVSIAQNIMTKRCATTGKYVLATGFDCGLLAHPPGAVDVDSGGQIAVSFLANLAWDKYGDEMVKKMQALSLDDQRDEQRCKLGAGPSARAGSQVGPSSTGDLVKDMAPNMTKAAMDMATGGLPVGMMLSIPGVTQVQYHYKGLSKGPEKREFDITGKLYMTSGGPRLRLQIDGEVEGDKNLYVEYTVNYKKEKHPFPTWSPFLKDPAKLLAFGQMTTYEHAVSMQRKTFTDEATGKSEVVAIPVDVVKAKSQEMRTPFGWFRESGRNRNGVKGWHEYEYYWNVVQVTREKTSAKR